MAIVGVPTYTLPTAAVLDPQSGWGLGSITLNAINDRVAFVFRVPKTGTLDKAEFRTASVSNNPDNGIRISFQDVNTATGYPDGTQDQYRDITGTISANTWQVPGLMTSDGTDVGSKRSVTRGDWLAVVIEFVNFVASDSLQVSVIALGTSPNGDIYVADGSTGVYANKSSGNVPNMALLYDDGSYAEFPLPGIAPAVTWTSTNFNSSSSPDEYALRFQVPYQCQLGGVWFNSDVNEAMDIVLYNASNTAERTVSIVPGIQLSTAHNLHYVQFADYTLSENTTYRVALKPTTTTNNSVEIWTAPSNDYLEAVVPGIEWYLSTRTDSGSWTDDNTARPYIGLMINGIEFSTGGGGGGGGSFPFVG